MLDLFQAGGILMLPIGFCSVIALAICLERWWSLRRAQVLPAPLLARMGDTNGWPSNAAALTELGNTSELGYLLAVGLANRAVPRDEFAQAMQGALDVTAHNLERHLTGLGVVASICPLLGILGTVVGLLTYSISCLRRDRPIHSCWRVVFHSPDYHRCRTVGGYSSIDLPPRLTTSRGCAAG